MNHLSQNVQYFFYFIRSLGILFLKKSSKSDSQQFSMSKLYEKKISGCPVFRFFGPQRELLCIVLSQRAEAMVGRGKMVRNEAFEDIRKQEIISGRSLFI